jgi:hypothetical protein
MMQMYPITPERYKPWYQIWHTELQNSEMHFNRPAWCIERLKSDKSVATHHMPNFSKNQLTDY